MAGPSLAIQKTLVSHDFHPVQLGHLYGHPDERIDGRLLIGQLQLRGHDRLDTLVGTSDDVYGTRSRQALVYGLSFSSYRRVAPAG